MEDNDLQFNVVMVDTETNERVQYTTDSLKDAVMHYTGFVLECIRIYDSKGKFLAVFDKPDIFALNCAREYLK